MESLGTISIDLGEGAIQVNLDEYIPIDETALTTEFAQHSTRYAYLAMLQARAEAMYLCAKENRERVEKQHFAELKAGQKITDAGAEALSELNAADLRDNELACKSQYLLMRAVTDAMNARKDMLVSLGAHVRAERDMFGATINFSPSPSTEEAKETLRALRAARMGA